MRVTIREALQDDALRLEAFLRNRNETSMFMRANLREYGIGNTKDDYAMRYFLREQGGAIQGVGAIANVGSLMMQASEGLEDIARFMCAELSEATVISAILGESNQADIMRVAFGLAGAPTIMDDKEPLFALDLNNLCIPEIAGAEMRKARKTDLKLLIDWGYAYDLETGLRKETDWSREQSSKEVVRRMDSNRLRVLTINGHPVAQTAFNAVLPDSVQVGGVYTPPKYRRNGYGRLVVALHLAEARTSGATQAILFSASKHASQAYRAIGFERIGHYTLTLFETPKTKE